MAFKHIKTIKDGAKHTTQCSAIKWGTLTFGASKYQTLSNSNQTLSKSINPINSINSINPIKL